MVSAIITTHNRVDLLGRAITSVLSQSYKDIELIVVSDGSTDGTDEFMKQYDDDKRVNYISYHPGKGGNFARNTGIKAAKGDFVAFLDDDDEWLPSKLEEQMNIMDTNPKISLVYTGTRSIYADIGVEYSSIRNIEGAVQKLILLENFIGSTSTVLIRKAVLEKTGLFDEQLCALQDYDLWIRICQLSEVGVVPKELVNYYNYNSTNQISSSTEKYEKAFKHIDAKYALELSRLSKEEERHRYANKLFDLGGKAKRNNNPKLARKYFKRLILTKYCVKAMLNYFLSFVDYGLLLNIRSLI